MAATTCFAIRSEAASRAASPNLSPCFDDDSIYRGRVFGDDGTPFRISIARAIARRLARGFAIVTRTFFGRLFKRVVGFLATTEPLSACRSPLASPVVSLHGFAIVLNRDADRPRASFRAFSPVVEVFARRGPPSRVSANPLVGIRDVYEPFSG